jgi:deazaflavin-dependent oxidoreductase (nitroreductase family)
MAEAKLAPNLPDWMVKHANRYIASGGADGHMYKVNVPGRGEITAPALLLTTTGRKSGEKFIFPLFYGTDGGGYIVVASKGGAPEHPGWYRNILANPDVEVQVGTKKLKARARTATGDERARLWKKALEFWPPYADYALKTPPHRTARPNPLTRDGPPRLSSLAWQIAWPRQAARVGVRIGACLLRIGGSALKVRHARNDVCNLYKPD